MSSCSSKAAHSIEARVYFTAAVIANALNRTPRGIRKALSGIDADSIEVVKGKETSAWLISSLPKHLIQELGILSEKLGYDCPERLLSHPKSNWQPKIRDRVVSFRDLQPHCIQDAKLLQSALSGIMPMLIESIYSRDEIAVVGLRDYKAVFGHEVTVAHWWKLANRTMERDSGQQDFTRTEIYLSEKLALKKSGKSKMKLPEHSLERLKSWLHNCETPERPSRNDAAMIWDAACSEVESLVEVGISENDARKAVVDEIDRSGVCLSKNAAALKRNFDRKLKGWLESGGDLSAVQDKRFERSGYHRSPELPEEDRKIILARAVERGGRVSQAWRECMRDGELSYETTQRFIQNPANKSHVPHSIREAISADVKLMSDIHHGPHQHQMKGAFVTRDWSDNAAGDWFQGDDATMNHYYWEETPEGIQAMRGQTLIFVDTRTDYILGFCLHSERNYNARIIREQILKMHDQYGLPRKGFYFERGIWKSARILTGEKKGDEAPWKDTEEGLREFCQFKHAHNPRSKIVERVIGQIQDETQPLPGYVGRAEMTEGFERIKKQMLKAKSGKIAYSDFLMSKAEWGERLAEACERHNHDPQSGRLHGMSPSEAFEEHFNFNDPLIRLNSELRYLLANHRKPMKVTRNGIRLTFKGRSFYYRNEATGALRDKQVLVWYQTDEEIPESITITDLDRKNPVEVEREIQPLSMTEDKERLGAALAQAAAHNKYARTLYKVITPHFTKKAMFRQIKADRKSVELGAEIETARKEITTTRKRTQTATRNLRKEESKIGLERTNQPRNPERVLSSIKGLQATRDKLRNKLNQEQT